jgi:hypothetical protein
MYANVALTLVDGEGKSYIYGYVPRVVATVGVHIKERGMLTSTLLRVTLTGYTGRTCEDIFARNGSAARVHELEIIFDSPDRYGKGLDWSGLEWVFGL